MRSFLFSCSILLSLTLAAQDSWRLDLAHDVAPVQPTMYGIFFEDINLAADGGLYAELVKNRSFEFPEPLMGWAQPATERFGLNADAGQARVVHDPRSEGNRNYLAVDVANDAHYVLTNEGFRGMGFRAGADYRLEVTAGGAEGVAAVIAELLDEEGTVVGTGELSVGDREWQIERTVITTDREVSRGSLRLRFRGSGKILVDRVSLMPVDTWRGRENGLRKDIVELLDGLDPGFLRFPGGCIVEGRTLAKRYQWKKTVGPVADRPTLVNRWNTEFTHRPTPDYYQSFGIGFFEYFQLAEDLGAEPLPILSCGLACQFNTGEMVPLEELDPYVQDALDLVEFANGGPETPWGKVRAEMGHPEPFGLTYLGIGNEQWGPEYIERYDAFAAQLGERHPEIVLVSGSGPFPDGEFFDFAMEALRERHAPLIDEHYYARPDWFRQNADRYDDYDRNGPKVFAGEYAAQSVGTASPENRNNWETALAEAAFMTGLERNAEVVVMTSYAPLMAHVDGWQWTPDLLWFDNLRSYGTPNYYVQRMYSTHRGTHALDLRDGAGAALTGQDSLYASAVADRDAAAYYLKVANTAATERTLDLQLSGGRVAPRATAAQIAEADLDAVNSLDEPRRVSPREIELTTGGNRLKTVLPPRSFTVIRLTAAR